MFESLKKAFGTNANAPTIDNINQAISELEQALEKEERNAQSIQDNHDSRVLELLANGDDKALKESRQKLMTAKERVNELRSALTTARCQLESIQADEQAAIIAQRWDETNKILSQRLTAAKKLQRLLSEVGNAYSEAEDLLYSALSNAPVCEKDVRRDAGEVLLSQISRQLCIATNCKLFPDAKLLTENTVQDMKQKGDLTDAIKSQNNKIMAARQLTQPVNATSPQVA